MAISKNLRIQVYKKYDGHCAYCGCELNGKFQVDHIEPIYRGWNYTLIDKYNKKRIEDISNYNPSCARCNKWKSTWSIEEFRHEISMQIERLKRDSSSFRLSLDYSLIQETKKQVKFYFETI